MLITADQIQQILPRSSNEACRYIDPLNVAMARFGIDTPLRAAAFIAQVGHESEQLRVVVEDLDYSAEALLASWPSRFDAALAERVARNPEAIANIAYASHLGNGPQASGDGWKYRGRGLIQITGLCNYKSIGDALGLDLLTHPELLEQPENAALSAARFWSVNGLNELADLNQLQPITERVNGGLNGESDRLALYRHALAVLA
ncbi:glycoside hydrolase family 19 protein [Pseudomonas sp. SDO5271_S396]